MLLGSHPPRLDGLVPEFRRWPAVAVGPARSLTARFLCGAQGVLASASRYRERPAGAELFPRRQRARRLGAFASWLGASLRGRSGQSRRSDLHPQRSARLEDGSSRGNWQSGDWKRLVTASTTGYEPCADGDEWWRSVHSHALTGPVMASQSNLVLDRVLASAARLDARSMQPPYRAFGRSTIVDGAAGSERSAHVPYAFPLAPSAPRSSAVFDCCFAVTRPTSCAPWEWPHSVQG